MAYLLSRLIPHFNLNPKEWAEIYAKCFNRNYNQLQVYNEIFGLPFDAGVKPITEAELKAACQLGPMEGLYERRRHRYRLITMGVDWGVNMQT